MRGEGRRAAATDAMSCRLRRDAMREELMCFAAVLVSICHESVE